MKSEGGPLVAPTHWLLEKFSKFGISFSRAFRPARYAAFRINSALNPPDILHSFSTLPPVFLQSRTGIDGVAMAYVFSMYGYKSYKPSRKSLDTFWSDAVESPKVEVNGDRGVTVVWPSFSVFFFDLMLESKEPVAKTVNLLKILNFHGKLPANQRRGRCLKKDT